MSRPYSAIIFATTGETRRPDPSPAGGGAGGGGDGAAARGAGGMGGPVPRVIAPGTPSFSSSHFGGGGEPGAAATFSVSIRARTSLIGTTCPSFATISATVPAAGDGISASTLSVEISTRGWSFVTASPALTSHLTTTPSTTLSPSWGMTTSMRIGSPLIGGQFPDGVRDLLLVR